MTTISGRIVAVGATVLFGVASASVFYQTTVPLHRVNMLKKDGCIHVTIDNYTHVLTDHKQCKTSNLDCLKAKGFKILQNGDLHGAGTYISENRQLDEFIAACKECNVHTDISVIYKGPLTGSLTKKKQTLDWGSCSVAELK